MLSSGQFAKEVVDALNRSGTSYIRRIGGDTKGGGAHSLVVQYSTEAEASPVNRLFTPDIVYVASGDDEGAFLINRDGIYAISTLVNVGSVASAIQVRVGAVVDNGVNDTKTRTSVSPLTTAVPTECNWCGFIAAGQHAWLRCGPSISGATPALNAFSIARLR